MATPSPPPGVVVVVETNHWSTSSDHHVRRYAAGDYVFLWVVLALFLVFTVTACAWPMDTAQPWRVRDRDDRDRDDRERGSEYNGFPVSNRK